MLCFMRFSPRNFLIKQVEFYLLDGRIWMVAVDDDAVDDVAIDDVVIHNDAVDGVCS